MSENKVSVGVIGLGAMGGALADALLAKGFPVTVWNRTPQKAARFRDLGATVAETVVETACAADVLVVCVMGHATTMTSILKAEVAAALKGKMLVQLTSIKSAEAPELDRWAEAHGVACLQGCILVYPDDVRAGEATVLYTGSKSDFDAAYPMLEAMGGHPVLVGDRPGLATEIETAWLCFLFPAVMSFLHGVAVCRATDVPVETYMQDCVLPLLRRGTVANMVERTGRMCAARRYDRDIQATVDVWHSGLAGIVDRLDRLGANAAHFKAMHAALGDAIARGLDGQDPAAVSETMTDEPA